MPFTITALAATLLSISSLTSAQFTNQSGSFFLNLVSDDVALNGATLGACHEGAAIEGLCVGGVSTYNFNTSSDIFVGDPTAGAPGILTYELSGGNFNVSESMNLLFDPTTNVALPLFEPSEGTGSEVAFDVNGLMNIQGFINDTVDPPTDTTVAAYYRWYVCTTDNEGYSYETLAWVMGSYPPENPTCCPVNVTQVFTGTSRH